MRTSAAPPYLLPDPSAVSTTSWTTPAGAHLPERLEHWDPFTQVDLTRTLLVDADLVRHGCGLDADARLAVTATWHSTRTRLAGGPPALELAELAGTLQVPVEMTLPGDQIGGRVELRTRLVLRHPGAAPGPLSPRTPGTVLWSDTDTVEVEGSAARFPTAVVDFAGTRFPDDAAWALDWDPADLDGPLLGRLRLLVNSRHDTVRQALIAGSDDPAGALLQFLTAADVARTLVRGALDQDSFRDAPHAYDEGSVGRMISELIDSCWPGVSATTLATWARQDPSRVDSQLQAHLRRLA